MFSFCLAFVLYAFPRGMDPYKMYIYKIFSLPPFAAHEHASKVNIICESCTMFVLTPSDGFIWLKMERK